MALHDKKKKLFLFNSNFKNVYILITSTGVLLNYYLNAFVKNIIMLHFTAAIDPEIYFYSILVTLQLTSHNFLASPSSWASLDSFVSLQLS